jgi:hypothetical protein
MTKRDIVARAGPLVMLLLVGCATSDPSRPSLPGDARVQALRGLVTEELLTEISRVGIVADVPAALSLPQLAAQDAAKLATVVARVGGPGIAGELRADRGGRAINFPVLRPCGRVLYANSLYSDPPENMRPADRNTYGPKWIVTMCAGDEPQLSVSVASLAADLRLKGNAVLFPANPGNEFYMKGIPPDWEGGLAVGPESALKLAAEATGARAAAMPELIAPNPRWIPQMAQWRVRLSSTPTAPGSARPDQIANVGEVFVGLRLDGVTGPGHPLLVVQAQPAASNLRPDNPSLTYRTSLHWAKAATFALLKEVQ